MSSSPPSDIAWCVKMLPARLRRLRNVKIGPARSELPDTDFLALGPHRTLRILRPATKGNLYYDAPQHGDRRESVNDNFFSRWANRPHPSSDCRCSFRCPSNSTPNPTNYSNKSGNRLSATEESINKEIARIRTSLCEAEVNGIDIDELERTVSINLANIENNAAVEENDPEKPQLMVSQRFQKLCTGVDAPDHLGDKLDSLDDSVKRKIVQDLDTYISNLLDEILSDTIKALAESKTSRPNSVDEVDDCGQQGYVNKGFLPDSEVVVEPNNPQNLEQSLIDIIDAKLGGTAIGKSLEDLTKEIDKSAVGNPAQDENGISKEVRENGLNSRASKFCKRKQQQQHQIAKRQCRSIVTLRVNRTVSVIREKIASSLGRSCHQKKSRLRNGNLAALRKGASINGHAKKPPMELEDYRRRFPAPAGMDDEVALRNKCRKPCIVFLHGFGSCAEVFQSQLSYFANLGYPCLAPDMLGHGMSSAPTGVKHYHFLKLLRDVEEVLIHYVFRAGQRLVLVGHNYGCSFATALAAKHHSRVQQLILISGGGPTPLAPPNSEGAGRCCLRASLTPFAFCGLHRAVLYSARGRQHPYCGDEDEAQRPSHMRYILKGMNWPEADYAFHRRINTPTLLVHGLRDKMVSLVQECQMERTMVKAFLEAIPTAGHSPMIDCPEQLNHMIHCFIDLWKNKRW